jgi:alpha-L-fucosidase
MAGAHPRRIVGALRCAQDFGNLLGVRDVMSAFNEDTMPAKKTAETAVSLAPWFARARFGMFIHWGIYSLMGHGEQPLMRELLTPSEYRKLADRFTAERYDPVEWAATAKAANMKYMVLTAKHHDGFCLFDTATTDFNAVRHGPKRDLIAEYVRACRKSGLRVGLYFSLPDWRIPAWFAGPKADPKGWRELLHMTFTQVEELMSNYGRIDLLWFDARTDDTAAEWRSVEMARMIRSHQPDIIINNRLPRPKRGATWGYLTPEQRIGAPSAEPWETCMNATRQFWGWHVCHEDPTQWRTERELLDTLARVITGGGNLLFNVGPRGDGSLPESYKDRAQVMGDWLRRNATAVYGMRPADFEFHYGGKLAQRDNRLYLFFLYWPGREFSLPGFLQRLRSARFVATGRKINATQELHRIILRNMPPRAPDIIPVVELTFDAPPIPHPWAAKRLWSKDLAGLDRWAML